ncbi:unnamed protein product [Lampetra fluviatilis]
MSSARHGRAPSHPGAVGIAAPGGGRPPPCGPVGVKVEVRSRGGDDPGWEPPGRGDGCRNGDSGFPGRRKISLLNGFDSPELMETRESPRGKEPADDASGVDDTEPIADGQPPTKPSLGADGWGRAVSSSIDVPKSRTGWNEPKMDHVMAAMVLTSLSSSCPSASPGSLTMPAFNTPDAPLPSEPAPNDDGRGGGGGGASRVAECGWDAASTDRRSQPSTPSPKPLAPDAILPFRFEVANVRMSEDGDMEGGSFLDEPSPRKRKNSLKVMFQCMWPNCEKVLSTASGMQRHIRRLHLGRNSDSDLSDGEEDFYYSEMEVNMDSLTDGLSSLAPVSPTAVIAPPVFPAPSSPPPSLHPSGVCRSHSMAGKREPHPPTQLSRSAPTSFWHPVHTDHAYQDTKPNAKSSFRRNEFSIEIISKCIAPVGFLISAGRSFQTAAEARRKARDAGGRLGPTASHKSAADRFPPRFFHFRKSRGEAKKCRKVYGMENKDMWCTACRWKKACQRFND